MRTRLLMAALVLPLALSACGDEGSSVADEGATTASETATGTATESTSPAPTATTSETPTESPSEEPSVTADPEPTGPACETVWVDGKTLPKKYTGCVDGSGYVKADKLGCSSGQRIVRYDNRFWAVERGPISETDGLLKDDEYVAEVTTCRG